MWRRMYPPPIDRDAAVRRPYSGEAAPGVIGKEFLERLGFNIALGTGRGYGQVGLGIGNPPSPPLYRRGAAATGGDTSQTERVATTASAVSAPTATTAKYSGMRSMRTSQVLDTFRVLNKK